MNLIQARETVNANSHLIGRFYKKEEISEIIIVPQHGTYLSDIIQLILNDIDYSSILIGHNEFDVIVLLDLQDYPMAGYVNWKYLHQILVPED